MSLSIIFPFQFLQWLIFIAMFIVAIHLLKTDVKKKSNTSSELSTIKGYLFKGKLTDHSPLLELGTAT